MLYLRKATLGIFYHQIDFFYGLGQTIASIKYIIIEWALSAPCEFVQQYLIEFDDLFPI